MAIQPPSVKACKVIRLGTSEIKDLSYSFVSEMNPDTAGLPTDTVTAFDIWADPADLTVTSKGESAGVLTCRVSLPKQATSYRVWFRADLSNGNSFVSDPPIWVAGWNSDQT